MWRISAPGDLSIFGALFAPRRFRSVAASLSWVAVHGVLILFLANRAQIDRVRLSVSQSALHWGDTKAIPTYVFAHEK